MGALRDLAAPPPVGVPSQDTPAIGEPGVLEALAREAGLEPGQAGEVEVPFEAANQETLVRALLAPGGVVPTIEHSGEELVRHALVEAAARFKRADNSYRIENRFRYLIARA